MDEKIIDLSDNTKYPASIMTNLNCRFSLGDDDENMLSFIQGKWTQPSFHWGWDEYSHEVAVKEDFLFHAFCSMYVQDVERRDAMIAYEDYQFVWKNKDKAPVPGYMSGETLCELLTRVQKENMNSMKFLQAYEEREAQRRGLNPTYADLMAELKKSDQDANFSHRDLGCGMICFWNRGYGNKQTILVNTVLQKAYNILDSMGHILSFSHDDIDWDSVNQLEHKSSADRLEARYYFGIGAYKDGLARVDWMLYPDGRYFADADGFGMEDNDEVNIHAYIDTECRVVKKFRP